MKNIALKLMFVGTAYHGWQVQKNAKTVAGTLERALESVLCHPVRLTGCGRTDAGVHARVYVANLYTDSEIPLSRLPLAVNTRLPEDIVVEKAVEVPYHFSAIGSCLKKEYTYRIYNSRIRNAFYVNRAYFYPRPLDEAVLRQAAAHFVGTHDFSAMQSVGTEVKSTFRTVSYFQVERKGDIIDLKVCADGFLYNMVRTMAGTILYAAEGKFSPEYIPELLLRGDRTAAGPVLPPGGLYLTRLWYNEEAGLDV
jgi:tRNA pseudouridine38-40 synthase